MDNNDHRARDAWIALRCQLGERSAFADLVSEFEQPLHYYVAKLVGDEDLALDVLQEIWLAVYRGIRRLKEPQTLRSWLYRIAHDRAIDRIRRDRSRDRAEQAWAEDLPEQLGEEPSFEMGDAEELHQALDRLELKHREVLVLHFLDQLSIAEIARVVGGPPGTVKSRIHYAKKALKEALENDGLPQ